MPQHPKLSSSAKAGDPVRRGLSIYHYRLWNTGSPGIGERKRRRPFGRLCRAMTLVDVAKNVAALHAISVRDPHFRARSGMIHWKSDSVSAARQALLGESVCSGLEQSGFW